MFPTEIKKEKKIKKEYIENETLETVQPSSEVEEKVRIYLIIRGFEHLQIKMFALYRKWVYSFIHFIILIKINVD